MKKYLWLFIIIFMSSCNGNKKQVVFLGDSITEEGRTLELGFINLLEESLDSEKFNLIGKGKVVTPTMQCGVPPKVPCSNMSKTARLQLRCVEHLGRPPWSMPPLQIRSTKPDIPYGNRRLNRLANGLHSN